MGTTLENIAAVEKQEDEISSSDLSKLALLAYAATNDSSKQRKHYQVIVKEVLPSLEGQMAKRVARVLVGQKVRDPKAAKVALSIRKWAER